MENNAHWVTIEREDTEGIAWRCTCVRHFVPMTIKDRVMVSVIADGREVADGSANLVWGIDSKAPPKTLVARGPDFLDYDSIIIPPGYTVWVKVRDVNDFPSDTVKNLHTKGSLMGDDAPNSYFLIFTLQRGKWEDPKPEPVVITLEDLNRRLTLIEELLLSQRPLTRIL